MGNLKDVLPDNYNATDYAHPQDYNTGGDPREGFLNELRKYGFRPPPAIQLDKIVRIPSPDDKGVKTSGWYYYNEFEDDNRSSYMIGVGVFGSWKGDAPERQTWVSKQTHSMTPAERERYAARVEQAKRAREEELKKSQQLAKQESITLWEGAANATDKHKYIQEKKIKPLNIRLVNEVLLVPIYDKGELCNLQRIFPDGQKRFMKGGKVKGCYGYVGEDSDVIYIAEGYSTAVSIHLATGCKCYIAFNAGNLYEVCATVTAMHEGKRVIICADNDKDNKVNVGLNKAMQAGEALNLEVLAPEHGTDFNDQHCDYGLDTIKKILKVEKAKTYEKKNNRKGVSFSTAPGILNDIAGYYNATSGNKQPGFAIQTALSLATLLLGRVFVTNKLNYSSMYFLNIAKSSTGKEHAKSVIEDILHAAGMDHLVSGDGYTSAGAVFSALMDKPRHITMIDEFGRYLESANKGATTNQMEANTQIMQAISRCHGIMRPPTYSTMTLSKDKQKEAQKRLIHNPALTIVAMTTPSTFFNAIDIASVNDGFLNRFIISISDAQRAPRQHKDAVPVPERILDWIANIEGRRGGMAESSQEKPQKIVLQFTDEAMEMQEEFQWFCIDMANKLETMNMSEISGRSNEMAMRMSLVCALARDPFAEEITGDDMQWSIEYVKANLERLVDAIKMKVSSSGFEKDKLEVLQAIRDAGEKGVLWSYMQKRTPFSKHKQKDLREILNSLIDADCIELEAMVEGRGRPTHKYRAIKR